MPEWVLWLLIGAIGGITFALRFSFIVLAGRMEMPPRVQHALGFVPVAVLSALIMPAFLYPQGTFELWWTNERLLAAVIATGVAWYRRSVLLTIVVGMVALWILQALLP